MEEIKVRLRWSGGTTLVSLPRSGTIKDLRTLISEKTGIQPRFQELRKGYPPSLLSFPGSTTLQSANIDSGESILIEKLSKPLDTEQDTDNMVAFRRIIPADNSCLFNSIAYALETRNKKAGFLLRDVISAFIESDPELYNETMLGKSNEEYCNWIKLETSWGGGIELSIISKYYAVEIAAVSIQNARIDLFGQEDRYSKRIYVVYDGIHYDVLVKNYSENEEEATDVTMFPVEDQDTYNAALIYAQELREKRMFTDVGNFSLMCGVCSQGFVGEREAVIHATSTGHANFQEYHK